MCSLVNDFTPLADKIKQVSFIIIIMHSKEAAHAWTIHWNQTL